MRFKSKQNPLEVLHGDESSISKEIENRELDHWKSAHYYKRGKINKLGLNGLKHHDYYIVCENREDMVKHIDVYNDKIKLN